MNADIGLDPKAYGFGVGIFFVGYLLFQLPNAAVLRRIGPRWWIAGSVIGWGSVVTAMAAIQTPTHLYVLRFLLGLFESGFATGTGKLAVGCRTAADRGCVRGRSRMRASPAPRGNCRRAGSR